MKCCYRKSGIVQCWDPPEPSYRGRRLPCFITISPLGSAVVTGIQFHGLECSWFHLFTGATQKNRATDAKEVGTGDVPVKTCCYPTRPRRYSQHRRCQSLEVSAALFGSTTGMSGNPAESGLTWSVKNPVSLHRDCQVILVKVGIRLGSGCPMPEPVIDINADHQDNTRCPR